MGGSMAGPAAARQRPPVGAPGVPVPEAVIVSPVRPPIGTAYKGPLAETSAPHLAQPVLQEAARRSAPAPPHQIGVSSSGEGGGGGRPAARPPAAPRGSPQGPRTRGRERQRRPRPQRHRLQGDPRRHEPPRPRAARGAGGGEPIRPRP